MRSLSNDKIEEFESIDESMPQMTENGHDVSIAPIYARDNNQMGSPTRRRSSFQS